jgi:hypothetical protein
MQGQIAGTHLNVSLLVLVLALVTGIVCLVSLGRAPAGHPRSPEDIRDAGEGERQP